MNKKEMCDRAAQLHDSLLLMKKSDGGGGIELPPTISLENFAVLKAALKAYSLETGFDHYLEGFDAACSVIESFYLRVTWGPDATPAMKQVLDLGIDSMKSAVARAKTAIHGLHDEVSLRFPEEEAAAQVAAKIDELQTDFSGSHYEGDFL